MPATVSRRRQPLLAVLVLAVPSILAGYSALPAQAATLPAAGGTANTNKQWAFTAAGSCPCTVAADGTGTYRTVQAAIDAVPANNGSRVTITIKAGTYREIVTIPS